MWNYNWMSFILLKQSLKSKLHKLAHKLFKMCQNYCMWWNRGIVTPITKYLLKFIYQHRLGTKLKRKITSFISIINHFNNLIHSSKPIFNNCMCIINIYCKYLYQFFFPKSNVILFISCNFVNNLTNNIVLNELTIINSEQQSNRFSM